MDRALTEVRSGRSRIVAVAAGPDRNKSGLVAEVVRALRAGGMLKSTTKRADGSIKLIVTFFDFWTATILGCDTPICLSKFALRQARFVR